MNNKLMVQWLSEWLIKHGTNLIQPHKLGLFDIASYQKAVRLGYIQLIHDPWRDELSETARLTDKGIQFLKENNK